MTFAAALRHAMTTRGVGVNALAAALGTSHALVSRWTTGEALPSVMMGDALADHLTAPGLLQLVLNARRRRCRRCKARFLAINRNQKYCKRSCKHAVDRARANRANVAARKLRTAKLERAIAAHCAWCEPQGICRDAQCALRGVSPLPLIQLARRRAA